jgi:hypothetical protein
VSQVIAKDIAAINKVVSDILRGGEQVQTSAEELSRQNEQLKALATEIKVCEFKLTNIDLFA